MEMKVLIITFVFLAFSGASLAEDLICPVEENQRWDKMSEKAFSKEAATEQVKALQKLFAGELKVAEEFIHQSKLVIEGAFYRMELDTWKHDPKNHKHAQERFCKFMAEKAYLVH